MPVLFFNARREVRGAVVTMKKDANLLYWSARDNVRNLHLLGCYVAKISS